MESKKGNYIPSSVHIEFRDDMVNEALAIYMTIRDWEKEPEKEIPADIKAEYDDVELLIEEIKTQLFSMTPKYRSRNDIHLRFIIPR